MRRLAACACLLVVSLLPSLARADDEKAAAERFREGRRAFEAHDYQRAAAEFEAANRAKPAAAALLGAGLAWELGGDLVDAAIDLADAVSLGGLEARDEATARKHLSELDAKLGHFAVHGPSGARVTIDGHDRGALPLQARVLPGVHAIELQPGAGGAVRKTATAEAGTTVEVDMTPPTEAPPPPPPPTGGPVQRTLGFAGLGIGAGVFIAGAIVGGVGLSARDEFVRGGDTSVSLHDEAVTLRTAANVLWVTAGVFGIAGAVLVFTSPRARSVTIGVGPSSASMKVAF